MVPWYLSRRVWKSRIGNIYMWNNVFCVSGYYHIENMASYMRRFGNVLFQTTSLYNILKPFSITVTGNILVEVQVSNYNYIYRYIHLSTVAYRYFPRKAGQSCSRKSLVIYSFFWLAAVCILNWRKGSPQETRPEWENSSLGFIEAVHQW